MCEHMCTYTSHSPCVGSENNFWESVISTHLAKAGSLTVCYYILQGSRPQASGQFSCLRLLSVHRNAGIADFPPPHPAFGVGPMDRS